MKTFCNSYCLKRLIKQRTCFKNPEKPSCIDLIITNRPHFFLSICVIETELSGFCKITISVVKVRFWRISPKLVIYRDFQKFNNEIFLNSLQSLVWSTYWLQHSWLCSTAPRCGSFLEKTLKKKHLCHHDKNYY